MASIEEALSKNLERKHQAFLRAYDKWEMRGANAYFAYLDYIKYICKEPVAGKVLKQKILSGEMSERDAETIYFDYLEIEVPDGTNPFIDPAYVPQVPAVSFYDKEVDELLHFHIRAELYVDKVKETMKLVAQGDPDDEWPEDEKHEKSERQELASPEESNKRFKLDIYRKSNVMTRLHDMLMDELSIGGTKNVGTTKFNSSTSVLQIKGVEIVISSSKSSKPHLLLETLFKDKKKEWSYDEVQEDWDRMQEYDARDWNKFYQAAKSVNGKVAQQTMILDFLLATKWGVRINPEYL